MAGQSAIRRNFESFLGLNQATTDLTRPFEFADEATNITHTRSNVVAKREGCQPISHTAIPLGHGLYEAEYSKDTRVFETGYKAPTAAVSTTYVPPSSTSAVWANPINAITDNNFYASTTFGANAYSDWLVVSGFSFNIPSDSYVVGIRVRYRYKHDIVSVGTSELAFAFSEDAGTTVRGEESLTSVPAITTEAVGVLGGEDKLWDSSILFPEKINLSTFGLALRARRSVIGGIDLQIDQLEVSFIYKPLVPETTKELVAMGENLYRKKTGTVAISYSGSGTGSFSILPVQDTGYQVSILEAGSPLSGWPKTYDTGASYETIADLYTDLNAETNWDVRVTPIARVNGAVIDGTSVTVDSSPQTFISGERVGFDHSSKGIEVWRHIHQVTGTPTFELDTAVSVADNDWLGLGPMPISSLPITEATSIANGGTLTLEVDFFEGVPNIVTTDTFAALQTFSGGLPGVQDRPFFDASYNGNVGQRNFSFVNARNVIYFGVPFYKNRGIRMLSVNGEPLYANTGLWKYDGLCTYGAGLPYPPDDFFPNATVAAGSLQDATYKYAFQLSHTDFRGNLVDGPVLDESIANSTLSVTIGGTASFQEFDWDHGIDAGIWNHRFASLPASAQASVNTLTVNAGHSLIPGCRVLLWDNGSGDYTTRLVTATTRTTITIDGEPVSVDGTAYRTLSDRFEISTMKLVIWRTIGDGTVYYYAGERPIGAGTTRFLEGVADASLGERLILPDREPDMFPKLTYLTLHQGKIVGTGNPDEPEAVYFADSVFPEACPAASNSFTVLGGGRTTAIASDTDEMLAVFKDRYYFNVVGDLDSLSFQVLEVSKGEFGCPGHHALVKAANTLIFPSEVGFKVLSGGQLVSSFEERLVEDFSYNFYEQIPGTEIATEDEDKLVYKRATAIYVPATGEYVCFIPCESGTPNASGSLVPNENSIVFVYNLQKQSWYKWSFPERQNMAGGLAVHNGQLWWQARTASDGTVRGQVFKQKNSRTQYDYIDDTTAITKTLRMTWDSLEAPSSFFRMLWLKIMQFHPREFLTAFNLEVNEYRNFDETTKYTQASRRFTSSTEREKRIKFKSGKASAISIEFKNDNAFERSVLSGYEYQVASSYSQDIRSGRGAKA